MAQDMGDDLGELLMRWVARRAGEALRQYLANYQKNAEQWTRQRFIENGMDPTQAQAQAQAAAAREAVCVPFGGAQDAALFAQMCRQDGVYAMPLTDPQGNGFLQFAVADLDRMQSTISRFAQEVARQHEQWIGETLRQPVPHHGSSPHRAGAGSRAGACRTDANAAGSQPHAGHRGQGAGRPRQLHRLQ